MNSNKIVASQGNDLIDKDHSPQDMKSLWERWDKAQKEETPSEFIKGYNLLGAFLVITGTLLQIFGSGFPKLFVAPAVIMLGAGILAARKLKALWLGKSPNN